MGKNRREKREEEREGFASKRSSQYRSRNLKALGILSMIGVIVSFACYEFVTSTNNVPGAPENAGKLGAEHVHASISGNIADSLGVKKDYHEKYYVIDGKVVTWHQWRMNVRSTIPAPPEKVNESNDE